MKRMGLIVVTGVVLSLLVVGCKKKEEAAPKSMDRPPVSGQMPPMGGPQGNMGPKVEKAIVIPAEVQGKWSKVVLSVLDKDTKKTTDYTVKLGSSLDIPGTGIKVVTGDFLPEFIMNESKITSASNEPKNPAVMVEVIDNGKSAFKGWLYSKYPTVHPFEHPKYALSLKEGKK